MKTAKETLNPAGCHPWQWGPEGKVGENPVRTPCWWRPGAGRRLPALGRGQGGRWGDAMAERQRMPRGPLRVSFLLALDSVRSSVPGGEY